MAIRRPSRFLAVMIAMALVGELPALWLLTRALDPFVPQARLLAASLCALFIAPFLARVLLGFDEKHEEGTLGKLLYAFYVFWSASLGGLVFYPLALLCGWLLGWQPWAVAAGALTVGTLLGAAGATWLRTRPRIVRHDVAIAGLPSSLDGYRIAQLSDLHVGIHTPPERVRSWVDRVNAMGVDLVAVTGDLITRGDRFVGAMARELGRLRAKDGVALCLGNHDYFVPEPEALVRALEDEGIDVLRNRGRVVGDGERSLWLAGVDDTWTRRARVDEAMEGRPPELPAVVLAHDPQLFEEAAAEGAQLVLSGHTHGGQITLPLVGRAINPARIAFRHTAGLYRRGEAWLYVNRGAGTTGPPIRIGAPSEIAVLTLRAATA